ncbi:MAG: alpha-L-fucosidase [Bacteroidetes bacterium]|nr:alpha-L-fucosidase [Bacteroidota bacterium]
MKRILILCLFTMTLGMPVISLFAQSTSAKSAIENDRMEWWRDARFGMFLHWGLYSIPAGEWKGQKDHAEWIRNTAQIPVEEYDKFVQQFNPSKFNADDWVKAAKDAGMKYIILTSKHHDGFCLFDSKYTGFDVMSTPFHRDILKELSDACHKNGIKIGWYYSIMDWHNPDYLPRRDWETNRPSDSTSYARFFEYLENQVDEIITKYAPVSVIWFDGEWENTWSHEYALKLYQHIKEIDTNILINNRIDVYRDGMAGISTNPEALGDFGTPEQEIPETGLPGKDWESCMTMNDHWGYNKNDNNWKSSRALVYNLVDIASKGGNFLLNVGPTSEGLLPQASLDRLKVIGSWMKVNGESIYGTQASPLNDITWGKCTQKSIENGTRLYLHIFEWPKNDRIVLQGLLNEPLGSYLLSDFKKNALTITRRNGNIEISLQGLAPDSICSVVVLDIKGKPEILDSPKFSFKYDQSIDKVVALMTTVYNNPKVAVYYTSNGLEPNDKSSQYTKPAGIKTPVNFKAVLYYNDRKFGDVISIKLPVSYGKSVSLKIPPSSKYAASGGASLTDAKHGKMKISDGNWLGFEGTDFVAVLDMGKKMNIHTASISYLVQNKAWIFEPIEFIIEASDDGKDFEPLLDKKFIPTIWRSPDAIKEYSDVFPEVYTQYIRFTAKNRKTCPEGHPGAGGKAWIFIDEIGAE